jgi:hypothetical protein
MNKPANNTRRPIKLAPLVKKDFAEWDLQGKYQVTKIVGNGSYGQVA